MSNTKLTPTWQGYIGSTLDALIIIQHILDKKIEPVSRRPHERERPALIKSGNVFVFIEEYSGIKRWTDGVTWSPSRVLGKFLAYRKMDDDSIHQKGIKKKKKANKIAPKMDEAQSDKLARGSGKSIPTHSEATVPPLDTVKSLPQLPTYKQVTLDRPGGGHPELPYGGHISDRGGRFFDQDLIKKSLSLTTTSKELHLEGLEERQTIHLVSYYTHDDVTNGRLVRPSKEEKPWAIKPSLWDAIKETSLGGKIPIEDEAYYYLDTKYQLQRMDLQKPQPGTPRSATSLIPPPIAVYGPNLTRHPPDKLGAGQPKHETLPVIGRQKRPTRAYTVAQQGVEYGIGGGQMTMGYAQSHQIGALTNGQDHGHGQGYHHGHGQLSTPSNYPEFPYKRDLLSAYPDNGNKREDEPGNAAHGIHNGGYNQDVTFMSQFNGVCFALPEIPDSLGNVSQVHPSHYGAQMHHLQLPHYVLTMGIHGPHITESTMVYYPQISQHEQQISGQPYVQQIQPQRYLPEYDVITKPYYAASGEEVHAGPEANANGRQKAYHFVESHHPEQYPLIAGQFNPQGNAGTRGGGGGGGISSGGLSTSESTAPTVAYDAAWSNTANKQSKHHISPAVSQSPATTKS